MEDKKLIELKKLVETEFYEHDGTLFEFMETIKGIIREYFGVANLRIATSYYDNIEKVSEYYRIHLNIQIFINRDINREDEGNLERSFDIWAVESSPRLLKFLLSLEKKKCFFSVDYRFLNKD